MSRHLRRLIDAVLHGKQHSYQVLALLGQGGYGSIFRARCVQTGQMVALKVLTSMTVAGAQASPAALKHLQQQFAYEIALCRQVRHRHIVRLLDWGCDGPGPCFAVFELLAGQTLRDRLLHDGALPLADSVALMAQVLAALECLHAQGIVHRDLTPNNIMLSAPGIAPARAVLIDFGNAIRSGCAAGQAPLPGAPAEWHLCSPAYSAPEQLRGDHPHPQFDLYAWGLIFLECLTGAPVYSGHNLRQLYVRQTSPRPVALPACVRHHPLGDLLALVLDKDSQRRTADAAWLQQKLRHIELDDRAFDTPCGKARAGWWPPTSPLSLRHRL